MGSPDDGLVPYAPDFTPDTLGKKLGPRHVLAWLLDQVLESPTKQALSARIQEECLSHIAAERNRRDMASHVVQALGNYGLMTVEDDRVHLTAVGARIHAAPEAERPFAFARHILASCNGLRLVELVKSYELRGEQPSLEDLSIELDRSRTSKSISTMKSWLVQGGVLRGGRGYAVDYAALDDLLGSGVARLYGLERPELEFILAARVLEQQAGKSTFNAPDVADLAEERAPGITIRRKSLGSFVKRLAEKGLLVAGTAAAAGGRQTTIRLEQIGSDLASDELRGLVEQSQAGFPVSQLPPLAEILSQLGQGSAHARGQAGEFLAVHLCLMLGLTVRAWRKRAPHTEIDLIADRVPSLGYQRWMVQVKNTGSDIDNDRVDREVGAAAGLPVSHILFVAPRASASRVARHEMLAKSRLTNLHILLLDQEALQGEIHHRSVFASLREQLHRIAHAKRDEARRRES